MTDLSVLLISDGRPGHYNLSEGIVAAIGRLHKVRVNRLEVRRSRLMPGRLAAASITAGLSPRTVLRLAHGVSPAQLPVADVIVSAGAETMPANVAAARLMGVPNIFYGSLRSFQPTWFALVLTSYASQVREPHPVMTLKPSRLDPDALPRAPRLGRQDPPRVAGLLIGGDGGGSVFTSSDWDALFGMIHATHRAWGTRWLVSNSRRTPGELSDRLSALATDHEGPIISFIDVRRAGSGTLQDLLASAEMVAVTADSSSMLSEAVWARRPVLALEPARHEMTEMEAAYRRWLEAGGRCAPIRLGDATPGRLLELAASLTVLEGNPLDELARLIAAKIQRLQEQ